MLYRLLGFSFYDFFLYTFISFLLKSCKVKFLHFSLIVFKSLFILSYSLLEYGIIKLVNSFSLCSSDFLKSRSTSSMILRTNRSSVIIIPSIKFLYLLLHINYNVSSYNCQSFFISSKTLLFCFISNSSQDLLNT